MGMVGKVVKVPRNLREKTIDRLFKSRTGQRSAREGVEAVEVSVSALGEPRSTVMRRLCSGVVNGVLGSWILSPTRSLRQER